jgi:RimJ/RimL family protein N-acetyltransferase
MSETSWTLTLSTERLILRPLQSTDYDSWYAGFSGRFKNQHKYDTGQIDLDGCDSHWFTELCQRHQNLALLDRVYIFGIFLRKTNQHLGNIDISTIGREVNQWANLGYGIHNQYQRQGFGKEAARVALIAGFENLNYHRIEAAINLDKEPSIAFAKSLGMQKECIRQGFYYENEQWVDRFIYVAFPSNFGLPERAPAIAA